MLEKIQKLTVLNKEVVDLVKEEKNDEVVEKLAEIQELTKEMEEEAKTPATTETPEEIAKKETINKGMEILEKFASLNISADSIKDLIDQFGEMKDQLNTGMDTITKIGERLEVVESAKGISKQAEEEPVAKTENVWDNMPIG